MIKRNLLLLLLILTAVAACSAQDKKTMPKTDSQIVPAPGNIRLLPGYVHKPEQGIDSLPGRIFKPGGLEIFYDIGKMAGNYANGALVNQKEKIAWSKTLKVNGFDLTLVCLKDKNIYATFGEVTNFTAVVKTDEELADFLLMMTTYGDEAGK
ncbi:MAG: hypothetical protein JSS81_27370 [Acidobacteria bacterium]|nr:hypothetical protein [Acidobacteriota bacterium]